MLHAKAYLITAYKMYTTRVCVYCLLINVAIIPGLSIIKHLFASMGTPTICVTLKGVVTGR